MGSNYGFSFLYALSLSLFLFLSAILAKSDSHFLQQKQRLAIQRLQNENNKLKDEILLDNKCNPSGHGYATSIQIAKLQDQADLYTRKVRLQRTSLQNTHTHIKTERETEREF